MDLTDKWEDVADALNDAISIAWDGCHKIYVLLDEEEHKLMDGYGYDPLLRLDSIGKDKALAELKEWYDVSCGLRFVNSVRSFPADPNKGFTQIIPQFSEEDEYDEDEDDA